MCLVMLMVPSTVNKEIWLFEKYRGHDIYINIPFYREYLENNHFLGFVLEP